MNVFEGIPVGVKVTDWPKVDELCEDVTNQKNLGVPLFCLVYGDSSCVVPK